MKTAFLLFLVSSPYAITIRSRVWEAGEIIAQAKKAKAKRIMESHDVAKDAQEDEKKLDNAAPEEIQTKMIAEEDKKAAKEQLKELTNDMEVSMFRAIEKNTKKDMDKYLYRVQKTILMIKPLDDTDDAIKGITSDGVTKVELWHFGDNALGKVKAKSTADPQVYAFFDGGGLGNMEKAKLQIPYKNLHDPIVFMPSDNMDITEALRYLVVDGEQSPYTEDDKANMLDSLKKAFPRGFSLTPQMDPQARVSYIIPANDPMFNGIDYYTYGNPEARTHEEKDTLWTRVNIYDSSMESVIENPEKLFDPIKKTNKDKYEFKSVVTNYNEKNMRAVEKVNDLRGDKALEIANGVCSLGKDNDGCGKMTTELKNMFYETELWKCDFESNKCMATKTVAENEEGDLAQGATKKKEKHPQHSEPEEEAAMKAKAAA